jgi:hypothetical protein
MEIGEKRKLTEVYGNSRDVPLTYQIRSKVDERFVNDLTRDKHIVLDGGSKQGKTCLRKSTLSEKEYILVQCTRDTTRSRLYELILKNAGYQYEITQAITSKGSHKISITASAEGSIFVAKAKGETEYTGEKGKDETKTFKNLEIDPEDPNDLVRVLTETGFNKIIVIEDFHYLEEEVQEKFAFDLKVFHETSKIVFVIIGVWLESNRLLLYNGDLNGRLTNINVDDWRDEELQMVMDNGKPLLNITFPKTVEEYIVDISQDNVGLLQELCYRLCEKYNIWTTQEKNIEIGSIDEINEIAKELADDQAGRYRTFISKFSQGLSVTELEMYKWILWMVINSESQDLRNGIAPNIIFHKIREHHPKKNVLQQNNVTQAMERVQNVQFKHKLQPLILDYSNGELSVVDANFLVYLNTQNKDELIELIGINNDA